MKRIVVLLATMLLSFGLVNAANQVDMGFSQPGETDTIRAGVTAAWDFYFENDIKLGGYSTGFLVWSPDGAGWSYVAQPDGYGPTGPGTGHAAVTVVPGCRQQPVGTIWDLAGFLVTEQDFNGASPDTVLFGGTALWGGMVPGPLEKQVQWWFSATGPVNEDDVMTLCIDSTWVPPAGNFVFVNEAGSAFVPGVLWDIGGRCFPLTLPRNMCPDWGANPVAMTVDHCGTGQVTLTATDLEQDAILFALAGNTGSGTATVQDLGNGSCKVTYTPVPADVGQAITVSVEVWDAVHGQGGCIGKSGLWDINVTVTNKAPTVTCGLTFNPVGKGNTLVKTDIKGTDADACDVLTYSVASIGVDTPVGAYGINAATGVFTFATVNPDDGGFTYTFEVTVTDGFDDATCTFDVEVLVVEPWEIQIEKTHNTLQGHYVDVDITMNLGSEGMGGFDFLIGYDASALAFTEASLGDYLVQCRWEYFTYRFNWNGNCGNACPSGLLRIVGMAETNNGPNHPDFDCIKGATGQVIATLTFFVSNDRTLCGMYVPIRFYWMDCGDNTISTASGDTLAMNRFIYDLENNMIQDFEYGFPGYVGAPDWCLTGDKITPVRFIDFINGGVDIVHCDSIDARGDINVNGVRYEIADAVMFTNYFISGLGAFGNHMNASIAASDVNADGIALSVADLVYLVRVIVGDANPYPKPLPGAVANVAMQGNMVTMDASVNVGAALLTFQVNGEIGSPVLGVSNMDMKYAREGNELRVLIYNIGSSYIEAGENVLVTIPGDVELTGAEVASYEGAGIETLIRNLPTDYAVKSFPNPFNAATTISVSLPAASDWSVKVYNVAGQLVKDFAGYSEAGQLNVTWNSTDNSGKTVASGIYFYKVQAGQFSVTKKMVLMK